MEMINEIEGISSSRKKAKQVAKIGFKKANEIPFDTSIYFKPIKNK